MSKARKGADSVELAAYSRRAQARHLAPLWDFFKDWFVAEPRAEAQPYLWRFDELRPLLLEAALVIEADKAERRVLALENPGLADRKLVTDSLYAGLQLVMPGEIAPAHRHSAAALRFIIEGSDSYTSVDGERAAMHPGDFIVTPSWAWHEHGNDGQEPTIWMDVLDVPLIRFLHAGFSERYFETRFPRSRIQGDSQYRYGMNMRPIDDRRQSSSSPVFSYPYDRTREVLEQLKGSGGWDPHHALKMEYIDPTSGGPAIPTISTFMQLVPAGFATKPHRHTAGTVYAVVEGRGRATFGSGGETRVLEYTPRDIFTGPGWQNVQIEAFEDSVFFSASDQAVQQKLGVWREQRFD